MRLRIPRNAMMVAMAAMLAAMSVFCYIAVSGIYDLFVTAEYNAYRLALELLGQQADGLGLKDTISAFDAAGGTYAALFDADMRLVSERTSLFEGRNFEPTEHSELLALMKVLPEGEYKAWFDKPGIAPHTIRVYFRRVGEYTAVIGVSQFTVDQRLNSYMATSVRLLAIAGVLMALLAALSLWGERRGNKHGPDHHPAS